MAYYPTDPAARQRAIDRARMGLPPEDPLDPAVAAADAQGYTVPTNAPPPERYSRAQTAAGGAETPTYTPPVWTGQSTGYGQNADGTPANTSNPGAFPNGPAAPGAGTPGNPAPPTRTPGAPGTPQTPYGTTPRTDMGSGTGSSRYNYGGFDFNQDANNRLIGKSAKYTLADATRKAADSGADDSWKTKAGAQAFAEKYIKPELEAAGFEVLDIVGDKMFVRDHADRAAGRPGSWVDWVENADGENARIAFQVDTPADATDGTTRSPTFVATNADAANKSAADAAAKAAADADAAAAAQATIDERARRLLARQDERMSRLGQSRSI